VSGEFAMSSCNVIFAPTRSPRTEKNCVLSNRELSIERNARFVRAHESLMFEFIMFQVTDMKICLS
jgi:hypothetical protein